MLNPFGKTQYSNEFHQLLITPSKHFTVSNNGILKYQKPLLKITLKNLILEDSFPIIHYVIRDKFSGVFYAESFVPQQIPNVVDFLHRAWSWKSEYSFAGLPQYLSVPSYAVSEKLSQLLTNFQIEEVQPGFYNESGVRVLRILESELVKYSHLNFFSQVQPFFRKILQEINHNREPDLNLKREKYDEKWFNNIEYLILPPDISIIPIVVSKPIKFRRIEWDNRLILRTHENIKPIKLFILTMTE